MPLWERLKNSADIPDRVRRGGGTIWHILERLHGNHTGVAQVLERREHRGKPVLALPRPASIAIVDLDVSDEPRRQPSLDERRDRLRLREARGTAINHRP